MCIYTIIIEILKFLQIIVTSRLPDTKLSRTISLVWFYHTYPCLLVIILHWQLLQVVVAPKQPDSWWSRTIWLVWFHHTYHRLLVIILHKIVVALKLSGTQLSWTISLVWFHHIYHCLLVIIYTHNYCRLLSCPNSQISSDCKLSNWPDSTNSTLSYKCWDILAPFITLCFSHKIVSFLSVLIGFKQPDSPWSRNIGLARIHKLYITL